MLAVQKTTESVNTENRPNMGMGMGLLYFVFRKAVVLSRIMSRISWFGRKEPVEIVTKKQWCIQLCLMLISVSIKASDLINECAPVSLHS